MVSERPHTEQCVGLYLNHNTCGCWCHRRQSMPAPTQSLLRQQGVTQGDSAPSSSSVPTPPTEENRPGISWSRDKDHRTIRLEGRWGLVGVRYSYVENTTIIVLIKTPDQSE